MNWKLMRAVGLYARLRAKKKKASFAAAKRAMIMASCRAKIRRTETRT